MTSLWTGTLTMLMQPVSSKIVNDEFHEYNASILANVDANTFQQMIDKALENSNLEYDLNEYNCASFALDIFNVNRTIPIQSQDYWFYFPPASYNMMYDSPTGLYQTLKSMKKSGNADANNIKIGINEKSNASHGVCK